MRCHVTPGDLIKLGYPPVVALRPIRELGIAAGERLPSIATDDKRACLRLRRYASERRLALAPVSTPEQAALGLPPFSTAPKEKKNGIRKA